MFWVAPHTQTRNVDIAVECVAGKMVKSLDLAVDDAGDELKAGELPKGGKPISETSRVVTRAVAYVRNKVGLLKRSDANAMMARRLVVEYLDTIKSLRHSHQMAIVPIAVEMCFLPSCYDIQARDIAGSRQFRERRDAYDADRAYIGGWGPLGIFGRRRVVTKSPAA